MSLPSLYSISTQYRELLDLDAEEFDPQALADTLQGLEGDLQVKASSVAAVILNAEALATAAKDAGKKLAERAARIQRRADTLRDYLKLHMEATGLTKVEGPEFTLAIRKNPPAVQIADGAELPDRFLRIPPPPQPAPDKKAIGDALKAGEDVPGCSLSFSTSLSIRP